MSVTALDPPRRPSGALGWAAAALVVTGLHAGVGWWLLGHSFAPPPAPEGIVGVTIDLEPVAVPVAPAAAAQPPETAGPAPAPQVAEVPAPLSEPPPPDPAATEEPAPAAPPEPAVAEPPKTETLPPDPAPADVQTPVEAPSPPAPEIAQPGEAVLAPMPPTRPTFAVGVTAARQRPRPRMPVAPGPDARQLARDAARHAAQAEVRAEIRARAAAEARQRRQAVKAARAAASREGGGAARDAAASAPVSSGAEVATWRGAVVAHLNAYKPASPNGSSGTARVAFTVDRGGRVVSASLSGSSGDAALDAAAVNMVRQASPVPAPPPGLGGRIPLAVPVRFH